MSKTLVEYKGIRIISSNLYNFIKKSFLLKALLINTITMAVLLILFEPTEKLDDYEMRNLLYGGATGEYSPFILYSDVIFGKFLVFLIRVCPKFDWYWYVHYALIYTSLVIISYYLIIKKYPIYIVEALVFLCGFECYIRCTFTKTAGIVVCASMLTIILAIIEERKIYVYILAISFFAVGTLIRRYIFLIGAYVFICYFAIYVLKVGLSKCVRKIIYAIVILIILYIVFKGGSYLNQYELNTNEDWKYHVETQQSIAALYDYGIPNYDENKEKYEDLGISFNDTQVWFTNLDICDVNRLTANVCNLITQMRTEDEDTKDHIEIIKSIFPMCVREIAFYFFILSYLYVAKRNIHHIIMNILIFLVPISAMFINLERGRLNHHVLFLIFIMATTTMMCVFPVVTEIRNLKIITVIICMLLVTSFYSVLTNHGYTHGDSFERSEESSMEVIFKKNRQIFNYLGVNDNIIYLVETKDLMDIYPCFSPLEPIEQGIYSNVFLMHDAHRVAGIRQREKYGINNVFDNMIDGNVYYLNTPKYGRLDNILTYLKEHYCTDIEAVLVDQYNDIEIYKFVSSN